MFFSGIKVERGEFLLTIAGAGPAVLFFRKASQLRCRRGHVEAAWHAADLGSAWIGSDGRNKIHWKKW